MIVVKADKEIQELIKALTGRKDFSKLTRKVITDKNGHRRTVFVKNEVQTANKKPAKKYWIQDFSGNRLTNEDAKRNIRYFNKKIEHIDSMLEKLSKAEKVNAEASKRRMQNYNEDLLSKLNPEEKIMRLLIEKIRKKKKSNKIL